MRQSASILTANTGNPTWLSFTALFMAETPRVYANLAALPASQPAPATPPAERAWDWRQQDKVTPPRQQGSEVRLGCRGLMCGLMCACVRG